MELQKKTVDSDRCPLGALDSIEIRDMLAHLSESRRKLPYPPPSRKRIPVLLFALVVVMVVPVCNLVDSAYMRPIYHDESLVLAVADGTSVSRKVCSMMSSQACSERWTQAILDHMRISYRSSIQQVAPVTLKRRP